MLGSGSAGNATVLASQSGGVLIDAGLSCRQIVARLEAVGLAPHDIEAVVITHAHGDHTRGASVFSRKHGVPVYTTPAVRSEWTAEGGAEWRELPADGSVRIGGFRFAPLVIPHDASETVAFRIETSDGAIGYATDIGVVTRGLVERFGDCRVLVLESNHALDLLEVSPYHRTTRARIGGLTGHLSNEALAAFIRQDLGASVRCLVLAHLSRVNNLPELAEMSCREALAARGRSDVRVVVTHQDRVADSVDLAEWGAPPPRPARIQTRLPFDVGMAVGDLHQSS